MAVQIKHSLLPQGKFGRNYTPGRTQKVKYIVIHYTATLAAALNNLRYFASKYVGASAHYFIDRNGDISRSVPEEHTAWSVGASSYRHAEARNSNSVNIEVVAQNHKFTPEQEAALDELVTELRRRYNLANHAVLRHYDVTGKRCPAWYVSPIARWNALKARFIVAFNRLTTAPVSKPPAAPVTPKPPQKKTIAQMAQEVIDGKHGVGHVNRRKSLGITIAEYEQVRAYVNARTSTKPAKKTIDQMAREVIDNKHGAGHENRRKSLGLNASEYAKVRARVNQLLK